MFIKLVIIVIMLAIVFSLASGVYYLINDKGEGKRMVKALSWRIGLSIALFLLLFLLYFFGLIQPHGL